MLRARLGLERGDLLACVFLGRGNVEMDRIG